MGKSLCRYNFGNLGKGSRLILPMLSLQEDLVLTLSMHRIRKLEVQSIAIPNLLVLEDILAKGFQLPMIGRL